MTHTDSKVGVRELRQNLSKHLERVKDGETLVVTERGQEVARLVPSGSGLSDVQKRLLARGARLGKGNFADFKPDPRLPPIADDAPSLQQVLDEQRAERLP